MDNLIIGIRPLAEYLANGGKPEKVFLQQGLQGRNFQTLFSTIRKKGVPYQLVPVERLNKLSKQNHQGVVAQIAAITYHSLDKLLPGIVESGQTPLLLLLDGITDVRNLGAIARSAECAGVQTIVIGEKGSAPVNADAIKVSAGALSRIPVCREQTILHAIAFLKECGIKILVSDENAKLTHYEANMQEPVAIVMGSEERGVSGAVKKMADEVVYIPMKGQIASLNVSVASGIILFEAVRQRIVK